MTHKADQPADPDERFVPADDRIIGVVFRWSLGVIVITALGVGALLYLPRTSKKAPVTIDRPSVEAPEILIQSSEGMPDVVFSDVTAEAGIQFDRFNGATGEKLLPETMGGGAAFFDFDNDGDQDLFLVNGDEWPHSPRSERPHTMALYRNDGNGKFDDVTASVGLDLSFYGMGVACGDYDGDGRTDLYVTAVGVNRLLQNTEGGFVDVTDAAGVGGAADGWSTSAGFCDFDRDGHLDLFVCNYIQWSREIDLRLNFTLNGTDRAYGPPTQYEGSFCTLYRNRGDRTFEDVGESAGIHVANPTTGKAMGKALAVAFVDADLDGWMDIVVANDTVQNFVFRNVDGRRFEEVGASTGVAFDSMGNATGAMGIDSGCVYSDNRIAVAVANFANEASSLYVQQGEGRWQFADMAGSEGIGSPSRLKLSFGLFFFDYDLDGRLDLLQANGHLEEEINQVQASQHFRQSAQLFWNCGESAKSCFVAVPESRLGGLARPIVGRGSTYADIDGDGDLDVLLLQSAGEPMLLRNDQNLNHHWIRLQLVGRAGNPTAIGARVEVTVGDRTLRQQVSPTRSYLSQVEPVLTFGLGRSESIDGIRIVWPNGHAQRIDAVEIDALVRIEQPSGMPLR